MKFFKYEKKKAYGSRKEIVKKFGFKKVKMVEYPESMKFDTRERKKAKSVKKVTA